MKIQDIDPTKMEYDDSELDSMIDVLTKAEDIKKDSSLYELIKKRMKSKVKSIKSIGDLRNKANELALSQDKIKGA